MRVRACVCLRVCEPECRCACVKITWQPPVWFSPSFLETASLLLCGQAHWPTTFGDSPVSASHPHRTIESQIHTVPFNFTWIARVRTQVLPLSRQAPHPPGHLPGPGHHRMCHTLLTGCSEITHSSASLASHTSAAAELTKPAQCQVPRPCREGPRRRPAHTPAYPPGLTARPAWRVDTDGPVTQTQVQTSSGPTVTPSLLGTIGTTTALSVWPCAWNAVCVLGVGPVTGGAWYRPAVLTGIH